MYQVSTIDSQSLVSAIQDMLVRLNLKWSTVVDSAMMVCQT